MKKSADVLRVQGHLSLAAAHDLPQNVMLATKPRCGRPPKTSKHTDDVLRQELRRDHHLSASEHKEVHQDHPGNVSMYQTPPEEGPEYIKSMCCLQNSPDST